MNAWTQFWRDGGRTSAELEAMHMHNHTDPTKPGYHQHPSYTEVPHYNPYFAIGLGVFALLVCAATFCAMMAGYLQ